MDWKSGMAAALLLLSQTAIAEVSESTSTVQASSMTETTAVQDDNALRVRQNACLLEKVEAAQQANQPTSEFGEVLDSVTRTTPPAGSAASTTLISNAVDKIYAPGATMGDLKGAAAELELSDSDIDACRNP